MDSEENMVTVNFIEYNTNGNVWLDVCNIIMLVIFLEDVYLHKKYKH